MADIPSIGRKGALDLTAQEVAGCIRAAQVYGTSERIVGQSDDEIIGVDFSEPNIVKIFKSPEGGTIERCELAGYSLAVDNEVSKVTFPSTDYTKAINSNLEPSFYSATGGSLDLVNRAMITITSLRNNEQRCVYIFASGQITVGECSS